MAWYNSTGKENHKSLFDNVEYDRCILLWWFKDRDR